MHNLEGISFEEVINDKGLSYAEYRKKLNPDYSITWLHITGALLTILVLCFLSFYSEQKFPGWFWFTIPFFSLLLGFSVAYISLFIHEAGHFYIYPGKKTNDLLANLILCSWIGIDIKSYRKIHWQHHLHLATPADTENSYFHPLTASFIVETLTGIHMLRVITNKNNKQLLGKMLVKKSIYMLLAGILINVTILFFSIYNGYWQFALIWIAALLIFFPFFATIRQIMEHRDELALKKADFYKTPKDKISRLFSGSLFSRLLGPAGFNKHMIHHWDPQLPFTALKKAEKFLLHCQRTGPIIESSQTTYFSVFKKLLFTH